MGAEIFADVSSPGLSQGCGRWNSAVLVSHWCPGRCSGGDSESAGTKTGAILGVSTKNRKELDEQNVHPVFFILLNQFYFEFLWHKSVQKQKKRWLVVLVDLRKSRGICSSQIGHVAVGKKKEIYVCLHIPAWQLICRNGEVVLLYPVLERLLWAAV